MTSKYDYVKIKVYLDDHNYFILSRFQLSRMLTFCQIPNSDAVRLSLEVKKLLVDANEHEIREDRLRERVFQAVTKNHFGGVRFERLYQTLFQFHSARIPLLIFLSGTGCTGKTTVSHVVVSKLNNCHTINTDLVMETIASIAELDEDEVFPHSRENSSSSSSSSQCVGDGGGPPTSLWLKGCSAGAFHAVCNELDTALRIATSNAGTGAHSGLLVSEIAARLVAENNAVVVKEWERRCRLVEESIHGEVQKALREGKTLVVEGSLVDLSLFISLGNEGEMEEDEAELKSARQGNHNKSPRIVMFAMLTTSGADQHEQQQQQQQQPQPKQSSNYRADPRMLQSWLQQHREELLFNTVQQRPTSFFSNAASSLASESPCSSSTRKSTPMIVLTHLLESAFAAVHKQHRSKLAAYDAQFVEVQPQVLPQMDDEVVATGAANNGNGGTTTAPAADSGASVFEIPFSCETSNAVVTSFFECVLDRIQQSLSTSLSGGSMVEVNPAALVAVA